MFVHKELRRHDVQLSKEAVKKVGPPFAKARRRVCALRRLRWVTVLLQSVDPNLCKQMLESETTGPKGKVITRYEPPELALQDRLTATHLLAWQRGRCGAAHAREA